MEKRVFVYCAAYALIFSLMGGILSAALIVSPAEASHSNIILEDTVDLVYEPGDTIEISGEIDDVNDDEDRVDLSVTGPGTTDDDDVAHDDGVFDFEYDIDNGADDGIYTIEVTYDGESVIVYFLIDEDPDDVEVNLDGSIYDSGDTVEISGEVDPQTGEDIVDIEVLDPEGDDDLSTDAELDGNDYSEEVDLPSSAVHGRYAVTADYDGEEGFAIFEVTDEDSGSDEISARVAETRYAPGDEVVITGDIAESDVESGEEVSLTVEDPDGAQIESDSAEPNDDGFFRFEFNLDDEADTGTYTVTLEYTGYEDKELEFTVSTSTSGGSSGGSGSGSSSGLTARLSKTSLLAGEALTVSGVVPDINEDELVNIVILRPSGTFVVAAYPEPESDESYAATLRLPGTLEEEEDYSVVVSYDEKEVEVFFDITGKATGPIGGAVTVETDKSSYTSGSTVTISGEIADDTFVDGEQITLQVYNPANSAYRVDPITPESDGTYSYSMRVGGPLGVSGEWKVRVTYAGQTSETTFDLTGGVDSLPRFNLMVEGQTYPIEYETDGNVKNMFVRPTENKLVISLDATEDGTLTIKLPRNVIDAVESGSDIDYIVVTTDIDTGEEQTIEVVESDSGDESRTLVIDYPSGTDLIEIQGTIVVPEFGTMVALSLMLSTLGAVVLTTRLRGKFDRARL